MEIGKPRRIVKVEPIRDPVPHETPSQPAEPPRPEKLPASK